MLYLYENWQAGPHKTVLHRGSCAFCNNGWDWRVGPIRNTVDGMGYSVL